MENLPTIIIYFSVFVLIQLIFLYLIKKEINKNKDKDSLQYLKQDIETIRKEVGDSLWKTTETTQKQSQESVKLIREITQELTKVSEGQKQVLNVTEQLKNLQDILKNPKQRGVVGEFYLESLLRNVMPPGSYQMQYSFSNGSIVDAVVFIKDQIIPIDSKFSLENYNRIAETKDPQEKLRLEKLFVNDLKNRISETAKYIQPKEKTTEFAFMFIPHEAIYYDLLTNKVGAINEETENLVQRAMSKYKVVIVSPTSFLAYLQTVLQGLKAMQIEESAQQIKKRVENLHRHLSAYSQSMESLGKSMSTTVNHYNKATKEFTKIDKDIYRITEKSIDSNLEELPRPTTEE